MLLLYSLLLQKIPKTQMISLLRFSTNLKLPFEWFSTIFFYWYNFLYNFWNLLSFLYKLNFSTISEIVFMFSTISGTCFHVLYDFWNLFSCSLWFPFLYNSDVTLIFHNFYYLITHQKSKTEMIIIKNY
jgi:hypothetical protein